MKHDFEHLLAQVAFAGENGLQAAGLGTVLDQPLFARKVPVRPQAIEDIKRASPVLESLMTKRKLESIGRKDDLAEVIDQMRAGSRKANIRSMAFGKLGGVF